MQYLTGHKREMLKDFLSVIRNVLTGETGTKRRGEDRRGLAGVKKRQAYLRETSKKSGERKKVYKISIFFFSDSLSEGFYFYK